METSKIEEVRERLAKIADGFGPTRTACRGDLRALLADHARLQQAVADPWRGLYAQEKLPAVTLGSYGTAHPDIPMWDDDREEGPAQLIRAQGFEVNVVAEEYPEDEGDVAAILYAWEPISPGDDWRLAAIYDTEDSEMAAMFVRPLAMAVQP